MMVKTIGRVLSASLSLLLLFGSMSALAGNLSDFPIPDLSSETLPAECYGILTDKYQVFYTQDETGAISMDQESLTDLQSLLRNDEALRKVIQDRATARNESLTSFDVVAQANEIQNTLQPALLLKEMDRLPTVKLTAAAAVKAAGDLQNFTHELYSQRRDEASSSAPGYSPTHIKRILTYAWCWEYEPFWTLEDTVAIAWSNGLHPLTGNDEVGFCYWVNGRKAGLPVSSPSNDFYILEDSYGDNAYTDDIDTDRGLQKEYDIQSVYYHDGERYIVTVHGGLFIINVVASNPDKDNRPVTYKGRYYHQTVSVPWSLSIGADLSISLAAELRYDYTNPLIRNFYYFDA